MSIMAIPEYIHPMPSLAQCCSSTSRQLWREVRYIASTRNGVTVPTVFTEFRKNCSLKVVPNLAIGFDIFVKGGKRERLRQICHNRFQQQEDISPIPLSIRSRASSEFFGSPIRLSSSVMQDRPDRFSVPKFSDLIFYLHHSEFHTAFPVP